MNRFLLDVNVLIALMDPAHVRHDRAHEWFEAEGKRAWATCPLTENGVLRIVGSARYPNSPGAPAAVAELLVILRSLDGHEFWPDNVTLLDPERADSSRILDSMQVTDSYLLALAAAQRGRLATFDRDLAVNAVVNGAKARFVID